MIDGTLAENRYFCKRCAATPQFGQFVAMARTKRETKYREPRSPLQALFIRRVQQELDRQGLTISALSKRFGAPPQRTLDDIMKGADPRLEQIHKIATALGLHPWELLREPMGAVSDTAKTVHKFPRLPSMFGPRTTESGTIAHDKKKRRR